jgi:hypothetical protein
LFGIIEAIFNWLNLAHNIGETKIEQQRQAIQKAQTDPFKDIISENTEKIIDYISVNYPKKTRYEIDLELLQQGFSASEMEAGWKYFYEAKKFWQKV